MHRRMVVLAPEAFDDLAALEEWLSARAAPATVAAYLDRLEAHLRSFDLASERGSRRDDVRPGLRVAGNEG